MKSFDPPILGNLGRLRARRQKSIALAVIDALERRMLLSGTGTLSAIASFNGVNGYSPNSGVADANGNIFGATLATTADGGNTFGPGVVFEIPAGTSTIRDLATLTASGTIGAVDSSGNVYGVEAGATASVPSTVFEIPAGTSTITPIATFPSSSDILGTSGTVKTVDSAGDIFGLAGNGETPFEVLKGSGMVTALENQNNPQVGFIDLQLGPGGNLYGVGTDQNDNTVIAELSLTTGNVTTLATIDPTTIGTFPQGIAIDSSGNIWGLMQYGGSAGMGSIFELPAGSNTVSLVASFTAATGDTPVGPPVFDASGNLFGLTTNDGANGQGTLFEIPAGKASAGPVDVVDLTDNEQVSSSAGFVTNSAGIAPAVDGGQFAIFGGLFSAPTTAATSAHSVHPGDAFLGFGVVLLFASQHFGHTYPAPFRNDIIDELEDVLKRLGQEFDGASSQSSEKIERPSAEADNMNDGGASPFVLSKAIPDNMHAAPQVKLSAPLEAIKVLLATTKKDLKSTAPLVTKQIKLADEAEKEGNAITSLQAQLAAETNAKAEAKTQKKITSDETLETKYGNQDTTVYNTVNADVTNISSLETEIQTDLDALSS